MPWAAQVKGRSRCGHEAPIVTLRRPDAWETPGHAGATCGDAPQPAPGGKPGQSRGGQPRAPPSPGTRSGIELAVERTTEEETWRTDTQAPALTAVAGPS